MNPKLKPGQVDVGNGMAATKNSDAVVDAEIAKEMVKRTDIMKNQEIDLAIRAAEARNYLAEQSECIRKEWMDWMENANKVLADYRLTRLAVGSEAHMLLRECGDVRKFFLSDDHEKEVAKLREFVELAERLRSLKNDGTLDKLADTILRLS